MHSEKSLEGYRLGTEARAKAGRIRKAEKIALLINQHKPLKGAKVLEVGTGAGYIAHVLSKQAKSVDSVDIVDDRQIKDGYSQTLVYDETLPFTDKSFDIVVSNHVLEHVPNQKKHFSEIRRVLKDDGIVYLASPNKWWLTDPHYNLPFISWLPRPLAAQYLKLTKRRKWDIYSVSLRQLKSLSEEQGFSDIDQAWRVIEQPKEHSLNLHPVVPRVARMIPGPVKRMLLHVMPTHLKILKPLKD